MPVMRILSLNTYGGRIPRLLEYLRHQDADVYCLSEMFRAPDSPGAQATDDDGSLPRLDLFDDIKAVLPGHEGFFHPFAKYHLNDGVTTLIPAYYGIATFVRSTIPILAHHSDFVFRNYTGKPFGEPPLPRNAHSVRLARSDGSTLVVTHLHGLWQKTGKGDTLERSQQALGLFDLLDRSVRTGEPAVLCGDLNVLPENAMLEILRLRGWRDLIREYDVRDTRTSLYDKPGKSRYADYLLVTGGVRVNDFLVPNEPEVSDHRPLILDCA
ncbi:MAG: hypothetical protein JWL82_353 [Parcubacteria group bacterium]|nr:hypothetical protein [Parcubacteria group bacterium]